MAEMKTCREKFLETKDELNRNFKKLQENHETFRKEIEKSTESFFQQMKKFSKMDDLDEQILSKLSKELGGQPLVQDNLPVIKATRSRKKKVLTENTEGNLLEIKIKKEKISMESRHTSSISSSVSSTSENLVTSSVDIPNVEIKKEQEEMPAPNWIPPKKKNKENQTEKNSVRTTRTKNKAVVRDSDVIVQSTPVTTITLSDTDESEGEKAQKDVNVRSTRTKTRKAQTETDSGAETDNESVRSTRTKTRSKKEEKKIENNDAEQSRNTRTKTMRKGKKVEEENQKDEPDEKLPETRSTRTKTLKKGAKEIEDSTNTTTDSTSSNIEQKNQKDESEKDLEVTNTTMKAVKKGTKGGEESTKPNKKNDDTISESTKNVSTNKPVPEKNDKVAIGHGNNKKKESVETTNTKGAFNIHGGKAKRNRSNSLTDDENDKKRSKSTSPVQEMEGNATAQTVYEDARSTVGGSQDKHEQPLDATYVAQASTLNQNTKISTLNATVTLDQPTSNAANCTVVVDKPQFNIFAKEGSNSLFTDDDSVEINKTPPKKAPATKAGKEVFSPYEKTTLKKKVEAFEKLQNITEVPGKSSAHLKSKQGTPSSVKEKAKMFTPLVSKFVPSSCSTSKISRLIGQQQNSTSNESLLAIKSAQKESREKQKKLLEREQAQKKKEAMLLAQAEAKRRLNEEKQLKAMQQRKALEAEKLKQLEIQKQKEAKMKQREQEREEYLQKQRLELEKKRLAQKKKVADMQAQRQQILDEQAKNPPIYMVTKLPKLPTEDCYDSDDPDYKKVPPPNWCIGNHAKRIQYTMLAAGEKIKNTLFCRHAQTPDLKEIFESIDPKKLKRTSSILWRHPPRYTMMPDLNDTKFEEDDELYDSD